MVKDEAGVGLVMKGRREEAFNFLLLNWTEPGLRV